MANAKLPPCGHKTPDHAYSRVCARPHHYMPLTCTTMGENPHAKKCRNGRLAYGSCTGMFTAAPKSLRKLTFVAVHRCRNNTCSHM